jgi:hypothetical protein
MLALALLLLSFPQMHPRTLASDLDRGYQVVAADLNGDGRPDLVALASGMSELYWFENPTWQRHTLATGLREPINLAAAEGVIAVADHFAMDPRKSEGRLLLLKPGADPRAPWQPTEIGRCPAAHRLRWADLDGAGRKVLINAPLAGAGAVPPEYRAPVPLLLYHPPDWKPETIGELEGVLHGLRILDWDSDGRDEILTASFLGLHLFALPKKPVGQVADLPTTAFTRTQLAKGSPAPWPRCGSSDVDLGHLGGARFLAAIEPWHGNQVVVYTGNNREVIDDTLEDGHALLTADLDHDGNDEIIAGCRKGPAAVFLYRFESRRWRRQTLDPTMAAASCTLVGDALACIDNHTLKLYTR